MAGGIDQSPGPRGGALAGDTVTATRYWSDKMRSVTEAALTCFLLFFWVTGELSTLRQMMKVSNEPALTFRSELSLTSHLSILAEDALAGW